MATMNWERLKITRRGTANAYDELPPTGSGWDRARYFSGGDTVRVRDEKLVQRKNNQPDSEFSLRIKGIEPVVHYVQTKAFRKRAPEDRQKMIASLKDAVQKLALAPDASLYFAHPVVRKAAQICQIHPHLKTGPSSAL